MFAVINYMTIKCLAVAHSQARLEENTTISAEGILYPVNIAINFQVL